MITSLSDKYAVREFVRERIGEEYLLKLFSVWEKGQIINWDLIPQEYVAKSTHGVGGSLIVWKGATNQEMETPKEDDDWRIHLINPGQFSIDVAEKFFAKWVSQSFDRWPSLYPEWGYRDIPPRILFEELLTTSRDEIPADLKFFCFDGVCKLIEVDNDRFRNFSRDFFLPNWETINVQITVPNSIAPIPKPNKLSEMIAIAETLSEGIDFVTVDLYDVDDRIVFGEMSFYPGGGHETFSLPEMERWLGSLWTLPSHPKKWRQFKFKRHPR